MASVDSASEATTPRTLHGQLAEQLVRRIRAGEWPVGSLLPSEKVLSEEAGVSRHTLRHALRKLRERYPEIRVKLFYKRDIERLAERYQLELAS